MINIKPLRVKRFTASMNELSIMSAIKLAAIPNEMQHESVSFFIKSAVTEVGGEEQDPDNWTVQERAMVVCHYMASTFDDGPNFSLTGGLSYSDYLLGKDYVAPIVDLGEMEGDDWTARQLTGRLACSIERLHGELDVNDYTYWQVALMAAQLVPNGDGGEGLTESDLDRFILARMQVLAAMPESAFTKLLSMWQRANVEMEHLLRLSFDSDGIHFLSMPGEDEGGDKAARPARFPVSTVVTEVARGLGGKYEG